MTAKAARVLVAVPAFNEAVTIAEVVTRVRRSLPGFDLLVINDGSTDRTQEILDDLGVETAHHLCNLGYGRAIQTAIKYAAHHRYDVLITLDADGQHAPEQVLALFHEFQASGHHCLVGSRFVEGRDYGAAPFDRKLGMLLFSWLTWIFAGKRIYDTTSGLKAIRAAVFEPLARWHFVDFHAEAIVYLSRLGFKVGEFPITVAERRAGVSMYSPFKALVYPLKTALMVLLAVAHARYSRPGAA
ncbi:MAG: glycosyltransferase family 2 protein [Vicinamibacteria bacterium]|nr:glycosyltransferase family 2 protein [Vicinamibacteria bacterium]